MGKSGGGSRRPSASVRERAVGARSGKSATERTLEQHTHEELKALAREQGVKVGRVKADTIANLRERAASASTPSPRQPYTGHPMEHPVYKAIARSEEPIAVEGRSGEPLTLVPHPTGSPDLISFSIRTARGREVAPATTMTRFEFENFAQRLIPAATDAPRYTPPKPRALSTLDKARYATSWSKTQAEAVAEYAKTAMPYMRRARIEESAPSGRSKTKHYTVVMKDRQKGVTLRATSWRDLAHYHEIRNVMPNGIRG